MTEVDFNFTTEQKERYDLIFKASQKEYPDLFNDDVNAYRLKVIIAHNVIYGDNLSNNQVELKEEKEE